jgi:hypothetical protein
MGERNGARRARTRSGAAPSSQRYAWRGGAAWARDGGFSGRAGHCSPGVRYSTQRTSLLSCFLNVARYHPIHPYRARPLYASRPTPSTAGPR